MIRTIESDEIMSADKQRELVRQYQAAVQQENIEERDRLFSIILEQNKRLIISIMQRRYPTYYIKHNDDMMQHIITALFIELPRYDAEKGAVTTWLTPIVVHACQTFANSINGYTDHYASKISKITKYLAEAEKKGLPTEPQDIKEATGIPLRTVIICLDMMKSQEMLSFDTDTMEQARGLESSPEEETIAKEEKVLISRCLKKLSPQARKAIELKYGFKGDGIQTDTKVAEQLGVSKQVARRILSNAQMQLQAILKHSGLFQDRVINREINELSKDIIFMPTIAKTDIDDAEMFMAMNHDVL